MISFAGVVTNNSALPADFTTSGVYQPDVYGNYALSVEDPDGTVPDSLTEVRVTGPAGFEYQFDLTKDYFILSTGEYGYFYMTTALPADGEYIFSVTDAEGYTATRTVNYTASSDLISIPDSNSYIPVKDQVLTTTTPTLHWDSVSFAGGPVYYQVEIVVDHSDGTATLYISPRTIANSFAVPAGLLNECHDWWWVVATDSSDPELETTRSRGGLGGFSIDCQEHYRFERMWPVLQQEGRGDMNSDLNIDLVDAILAVQIMIGNVPAYTITSGVDINNDSRIGMEEVVYIMQDISEVR